MLPLQNRSLHISPIFMVIKNKKGFSLIEILVYISILVFMLAIILEVVISITRSDRIIRTMRNIENSTILSMERITREVRQADSITVIEPDVLVLEKEDGTVEFYLSNSRLFIKENGVEIGALTASSTRVADITFTRFASSTSEGVRVKLTLESGTTTNYRTENFYTSVIKRNK